MAKFVKFLGTSHIKYKNVGLYDNGMVRLEHVVNGKQIGSSKVFDNVEAAEDWFDNLADGGNTQKLLRAIDEFAGVDAE